MRSNRQAVVHVRMPCHARSLACPTWRDRPDADGKGPLALPGHALPATSFEAPPWDGARPFGPYAEFPALQMALYHCGCAAPISPEAPGQAHMPGHAPASGFAGAS